MLSEWILNMMGEVGPSAGPTSGYHIDVTAADQQAETACMV
jgi:hypothetical protein